MNGEEPAVVTELRELVDRPSVNPPGDEKEVIDYLVDRFKASEVDFDIETHKVKSDRSNVVARAGDPASGTLLLTGHVDVVPADESAWSGDPFDSWVEDGNLYGRGTADMKGSIAAQIVAAESYLSSHSSPGEVVLAYVVDEESTGDGTKELVNRGLEADAAILGEPTDLGLGIAHFGSVRYTISVNGKRSHAARPGEGTNAIEGARQVLNHVRKLDKEVAAAEHEYLDRQSAKPTMIEGGVGGNVIPDAAEFVLDWRFHPGPSEESVFRERLLELFADVSIDGEEAEIDIELWQFTRGAEVPEDIPIVEAVKASAQEVGYTCTPFGCNYGADTPHLIYDAKIPTVLFGPGNIDAAHSIDEHVEIEDLTTAVKVYRESIGQFFQRLVKNE